MEGQSYITKEFENVTLDNLSHSLMFIGEKGSGRHTFCKEICDKVNIELEELNYADVTDESIVDMCLNPIPKGYVLNVTGIENTNKSEVYQNRLLKFLEEPTNSVYIFLLTEPTHNLLGTIVNRCKKYEFEPYTQEYLSTFTNNPKVLKYSTTPGLVKELEECGVDKYESFCSNIITNVGKASVPNLLVLPNYIIWNDRCKGIYDPNIFFRVLSYVCFNKYLLGECKETLYLCVQDMIKEVSKPGVIKKRVFEKYLIDMKRES